MVGMVCTKVDDADEDDDDEKKTTKKKSKTKKKKSSENHHRDHFVTALKRRIRLGVGVTLAVAISSPLFLTMTASVSDDTAVAVAGILAFVHLATHDYRAGKHEFRQRLGRGESGVGDFQREFNGEPFEDGFGRVRVRVVGGWSVYYVHAFAEAVAKEAKTSSFATTVSAHGIAAWMPQK